MMTGTRSYVTNYSYEEKCYLYDSEYNIRRIPTSETKLNMQQEAREEHYLDLMPHASLLPPLSPILQFQATPSPLSATSLPSTLVLHTPIIALTHALLEPPATSSLVSPCYPLAACPSFPPSSHSLQCLRSAFHQPPSPVSSPTYHLPDPAPCAHDLFLKLGYPKPSRFMRGRVRLSKFHCLPTLGALVLFRF